MKNKIITKNSEASPLPAMPVATGYSPMGEGTFWARKLS